MVLVFFMLSGYVIGLTYLHKPNFVVSDYIKKRLIRLYPIYIISIGITLLFFSDSAKVVLSNLFFCQNIFSNGLKDNVPLWSLNHEIIYYLLAIPILKFNLRLKYIFPILFLLLAASVFKLAFPAIIEGYLVGSIFWLTGFAVSKLKLSLHKNEIQLPAVNQIVSLFFLLLSCDFLNTIGVVFSKIKFIHGTSFFSMDAMVNVYDFGLILFCLYAILVASSIRTKWVTYIVLLVYLSCWSHLLLLIANKSFFKVNFFYTPAVFLSLSTMLQFVKKPIVKSISVWSFLGSVSYAIYVIHMPVLRAMGKVQVFSGTTFSFMIRFLVLLFMVLTIAYLLEKIIQPYIKQLFYKKRIAAVPV